MKLTDDNLPIDPEKAGKLACESCGAEFTCNAGRESCWCFDIKVPPEDLDVLKENYNRCLCRECLEKSK
jgi:Cysteine-rich CWC